MVIYLLIDTYMYVLANKKYDYDMTLIIYEIYVIYYIYTIYIYISNAMNEI